MAILSSMKINSKLISEGQRVKMDEGFTLIVRGFTDDFIDAQSRLMRKEARYYRGDTTLIPFHRTREINAQLVAEHLLIGVEGLYKDDAETVPVTIDELKRLIMDPDCKPLYDACWEAIGRVNAGLKDSEEEAVGN